MSQHGAQQLQLHIDTTSLTAPSEDIIQWYII